VVSACTSPSLQLRGCLAWLSTTPRPPVSPPRPPISPPRPPVSPPRPPRPPRPPVSPPRPPVSPPRPPTSPPSPPASPPSPPASPPSPPASPPNPPASPPSPPASPSFPCRPTTSRVLPLPTFTRCRRRRLAQGPIRRTRQGTTPHQRQGAATPEVAKSTIFVRAKTKSACPFYGAWKQIEPPTTCLATNNANI
jgi:hypothetical protein